MLSNRKQRRLFQLIHLVELAIVGIAISFFARSSARAFQIRTPAQEHEYADTVLFPAFVAKINGWRFSHPAADPNHVLKLDKKDAERFKAAEKSWDEFREAMKRAGY